MTTKERGHIGLSLSEAWRTRLLSSERCCLLEHTEMFSQLEIGMGGRGESEWERKSKTVASPHCFGDKAKLSSNDSLVLLDSVCA